MSIKLNVDERFWGSRGSNFVVVEVGGNSIGECLNHLVKQQPTIKEKVFDEDGHLSYPVFVFVNRKLILYDKLAKSVKNGDEISIINGAARTCCG